MALGGSRGKYKKNISPPRSIKRKKSLRNRKRNAAEKAVAYDNTVDRFHKAYGYKKRRG